MRLPMNGDKRNAAAAMVLRARRHFQTLAILGAFDKAEEQATAEQFAVAARVTARILSELNAWRPQSR
jgi:hypothetical protein